jgi:undecaprenyl-diphosphatase
VDLLTWVKAFVLGIVEGATEFIPVSSTGHLILAGEWLAFEADAGEAFDIVIQLGAILAVVWLERVKILGSLAGWRDDPVARRFLANLAIAFVPAAAVGFFFHDFITERLFNPFVVALSLVVGGVVILAVERWHPPARSETVDDLTYRQALGIGLAQMLSLIPGVSRSGATIMGALGLGASRVAAAEFSFFLAIPVMFAASGYALWGSRGLFTPQLIPVFAIGFLVSFASALLVVRAFIGFVKRHTFVPFAWYRIVFGGVLLAYYW